MARVQNMENSQRKIQETLQDNDNALQKQEIELKSLLMIKTQIEKMSRDVIKTQELIQTQSDELEILKKQQVQQELRHKVLKTVVDDLINLNSRILDDNESKLTKIRIIVE